MLQNAEVLAWDLYKTLPRSLSWELITPVVHYDLQNGGAPSKQCT